MPKYFLALCICIVTAYGCQSTGQNLPQQTANTRVVQTPQFAAPANAYAALSQRYTDAQARRDQILLKQTKSAIDRGDIAYAQSLISSVAAVPNEAALADAYLRLKTHIQTRQGQPELATQTLLTLRAMVVDDVETIRQICAQIDATACVIQAFVVQQLLAGQIDSVTQQTRIWATLQSPSALPQNFDAPNVESIRLLMVRISQLTQIPNAEQLVTKIRRNWFALSDTTGRAGTPR